MYDLENTYYWLSHSTHPFPYTIRVLISDLHAEVEAGNFAQARRRLQALKTSVATSDPFERALVLMQCALAVCKMHHPSEALRELNQAIRLLDKPNTRDPFKGDARALAHWMLGNLTLPFSNASSNVIATWEQSLQFLENLGYQSDAFKNHRQWYQDRCAEMRQGINDAVTWKSGTPFLERAALFCGNLDALEVRGHGPSGGTSGTAAANQVRLHPVNENFRIGDQKYLIYNLRGTRRLILLNSKHNYLIVKVPDDSMNKVGLSHRDYVLIRREDSAEDGDMVAIQPVRDGQTLTLRTYLKKRDHDIFQPQSSSPQHPIFEINRGTDDQENPLQLEGIVLGVFKPDDELRAERRVIPTREYSYSAPVYASDETLSILPVYAAIPAGKANPVPEHTDSMLESGGFWIDGKRFALKKLRGSKRTANLNYGETIALKVNGDSMNRAGIEDGDYVLLRLQDSADNGDIVAAVIKNVDRLATLKRYEVTGKTVILKPESTNRDHQEYHFDALSSAEQEDVQPFHIVGIATAVLKSQDQT